MSAEKILITGAAGFAGSHLAEFLIRKGHQDWTMGKDGLEIHGADRWYTRMDNIAHLRSLMEFHEFDMTDYGSVRRLLEAVQPDRIFHLAAQSFVPTSFGAPTETLTTNITGQLNLLEAVRELGLDPTIQIACSSEEYGLVLPEETPIKETQPLRPLSPYAVSKVAQDFLGYQYHRSYGQKIVRTRAFNHTGPRRGEQFATSTFAKQIAEIEAGVRSPMIQVGNLEALRDFTDVRDMVQAYWLATEKGEPGEVYNICSGKTTAIGSVLSTLLDLAGLNGKVQVFQDPARMRPSDVPVLYGDATKFCERTGWAPRIPLDKTLRDLLAFWRAKTAAMLS